MMKHMHPLSLSFYFKVYGKYVIFETLSCFDINYEIEHWSIKIC